MISLTIYLDLIRQNIETNPGMEVRKKDVTTIKVVTYNTNGLGDKKKLKRLLTKISPIVEKGGIVLLQETHLKDTSHLNKVWKYSFESNCSKTNSAGVIILYKNDFEILEKYSDDVGRNLMLVLQHNEIKLIISNSYFPNDHKDGNIFAEKMFQKLLELQYKFPEHQIISGGDFNLCMTEKDSLNRNSSTNEKLLAETIHSNNKITNLVDSYRLAHKEGGYTWKRGILYSRLDYIFITSQLTPNMSNSTIDWAFESSDHAALQIELKFRNTLIKGPGIVRINTNILNNPEITKQVETELEQMMEQTDRSWNPHARLEFFKVAIRSIFASKTCEVRKKLRSEINDLEDELNQLEEFKVEKLNNQKPVQNPEIITKIDNAIEKIRIKLQVERVKLEDSKTFVSKAKWFEYGEKPNKFFLNLTKSKQNQKLITKITNGKDTFTGQEEVVKGITEFYGSLYSAKKQKAFEKDDFYKYCPKLTNEQSKMLDTELTNIDLEKALKTCKESSPGPDGISYLIYKKFWKIAGPIILDAWKYSIKNQMLPPSHNESIITLLPKEGKNISDIKNWRPITLSNCDSKIITKAISIKVAKVLDSIIDRSQTAYIPGRSVADNLRANFFVKKHCKQNNLDSVLISLDAKKAFDSVDHKYIANTLEAYGFGKSFINIFKILYKDITARILINGFKSEVIKIKRGVKQGDALSCAIFIICIDPLIRNINKSTKIKEIKLQVGNKKNNIYFKGCAYADDVSVICEGTSSSIQGVFDEYNKLTERSGLELNAEKTEILRLNNNNLKSIEVTYMNSKFKITPVERLKICGLFFSSTDEDEYRLNVLEKINKLIYKMKLWTPRHLTMEGKTLIVKTFGLSQLIYNMQSYGFKAAEIKKAESEIFKFIWSSNISHNGVDRIKRATMKNDYENGGMKVTDVECLDRSLKLKQFIRASNSNHLIAKIQELVVGKEKEKDTVRQEYFDINNKEDICCSAQETLNIITDYNRDLYQKLKPEEYESDKNLIEEISSINISMFLKRKNKVFSLCILKSITKLGIKTLGELVQAYEHETEPNINKSMKLVLNSFPKNLVLIAKCFNENINEESSSLKYIKIANGNRILTETITVKEFQITLKNALGKLDTLDCNNKLGIENFDMTNLTIFRKNCTNAKLRNIYFRLIHNDFFTHSRMKRYKMTTTDNCPRCGQVETTPHLLWECCHSKRIWEAYNEFMIRSGNPCETVKDYKGIYEVGKTKSSTLIKIRVIQELIQIKRPTNWNIENINVIATELKKIETYNTKKH